MDELVMLLKEQGLTIGSCESLTAGLFTSKIAEVPGASNVLKGGIVTYQTSCKTDVAHVDTKVIDTYGVVSSQCAQEMALKVQKMLGVDVCVSFSGNAGPTALEGKPAGLVYCALAIHQSVYCYECQFPGSRNDVRNAAVNFMCIKIKEQLKKK